VPQAVSKPLILILSIIFFALLYLLAPVLTPFLISALLAYMANPLASLLTRWHVPRLLSTVIVFLIVFSILFLLLALLIPLLEKQLILFIKTLPAMLNWIQAALGDLMKNLHIQPFDLTQLNAGLLEQQVDVGSIAAWLSKKMFYSGLAVAGFFINLFLIPVVTFYLIRDWHLLLSNIQHLFPRSIEPTVTRLASQSDQVLGAFIRGQLLVMLSLGVIYSIGLSLIGINLGLIIGLFAGIANIVPYLGFIIGFSTASIAAYIQFGIWMPILFVLLVFTIGQLLEGTILTPLFVGKRIGLHPVAVIFAVLAGGALFGFFGILLALPAASVMMVLLRYVDTQYRQSALYK